MSELDELAAFLASALEYLKRGKIYYGMGAIADARELVAVMRAQQARVQADACCDEELGKPER